MNKYDIYTNALQSSHMAFAVFLRLRTVRNGIVVNYNSNLCVSGTWIHNLAGAVNPGKDGSGRVMIRSHPIIRTIIQTGPFWQSNSIIRVVLKYADIFKIK